MRKIFGRLGVVVLAAVVATLVVWIAGEAWFRIRSPRSYVPDPTLTPHATFGWDSVPSVAALPLNQSDQPVVIFAGDSFTHGKDWPAEAQRRLRDRGVAINGFNLGVSGYGTTQEWMKVQSYAPQLHPRAIVVLLFAWNDLRDNYPYPQLYYGPQRTTRPFLLLDGNSSSLSPAGSLSLGAFLDRSEFFLRVVNYGAMRINSAMLKRWPDAPTRWHWRGRVYYEDAAAWQPFYQSSQAESAYVRGAYDTTIEAFRRLRSVAADQHASLLVIGIDNSFTVDDDDAKFFIAPNPSLDPSLPMKRMASLLAREQIDFIDAQPRLRELRLQLGRDVYNGPPGGLAGHLDTDGDHLVGAIAAEWLTARAGLIATPSAR